MATENDTGQSNIFLVSKEEITSNIAALYALSAVTDTYTKYVSILSSNIQTLGDKFLNLSTSTYNLAMDIGLLNSGFSGLIGDDVTNGLKDMSNNMSKLSKLATSLSGDFSDLKDNIDNVADTDLSGAKDEVDKLKKATEKANKKAEKKAKKDSKAKADDSKKKSKSTNTKSGLEMLKKGMDVYDKYIKASNGLSGINDGSQSQMELLDKVNAAATRSSISNSDMSTAVTDIGSLDTFAKDNDQAIAFSELLQKSLKIDGSDLSLTSIAGNLSDGLLKGDEFDSLIKSAPSIGEAMTKWTGKSSSELKAMAEQGNITADMLKNSMFFTADSINTKFDSQPKTFADIWIQIKNTAMNALNPLMQLISDITQSKAFQGGLNLIISGLNGLSGLISSLVNFITNNGTIIQSLLIALGVVIMGVLAASIISWFMMYLPIILIIGAITAIIYIVTQLGASFQDVFSFIGGIVGVFGAFLYNIFVTAWNFIAAFVNFFANAFTNPIASIKVLFLSLVLTILSFLENAAKGLDKLLNSIPGFKVNITGNLEKLTQGIEKEIADTKKDSQLKTVMDTKEQMDYADGADFGSEWGLKAYDKVNGAVSSITDVTGFDIGEYSDKGTPTDPVTVEGNVDVNMEEEDLGYLRKMAERDYIANIATNTLAPNISVSFGDVHETADVNQLFSRIQTILKEQIAVSPEGVY
ncbi:MAG: tape measure protein [Mobilitalea sp.]